MRAWYVHSCDMRTRAIASLTARLQEEVFLLKQIKLQSCCERTRARLVVTVCFSSTQLGRMENSARKLCVTRNGDLAPREYTTPVLWCASTLKVGHTANFTPHKLVKTLSLCMQAETGPLKLPLVFLAARICAREKQFRQKCLRVERRTAGLKFSQCGSCGFAEIFRRKQRSCSAVQLCVWPVWKDSEI